MSDFLTALMELAKLGTTILLDKQRLETENAALKAQVAKHDVALKPAPPPAEPAPAPDKEG